jgi:hypothetical protein
MTQCSRKVFGMLALHWAFIGQASAQGLIIVGPGSNEAGSTVQGDILRGQGSFLVGAGLYNYYSSMGEAIHVNTMIGLNEYIYQSIRFENAEKAKRRAASAANRLANHRRILDRIRNNPDNYDLTKGAALNALFEQLLDPKTHPSSYRENALPLDGIDVRRIPFFYGPKGATISMARISPVGRWPVGLRGEEFARERREYERALDLALEQQLEGKMSREAVLAVEAAVRELFVRLDQVIPPEKDKIYIQAKDFLRGLESSKELLKLKEIEQILGEIERFPGTTIYDLVVFMQAHNLRFGVPEIGAETALYPTLYASMKQQLDEAQAGINDTGN